MNAIYESELYHHGIKGQKWGVRRFEDKSGHLTSAGKKRYADDGKAPRRLFNLRNRDVELKKGTDLSRIQTNSNFENFAFYATYKKNDVDKYAGLFGKNLTDRARAEARRARREKSDDYEQLKERADNMKIYKLTIKSTDKLVVPSNANAALITKNLCNDPSFTEDLRSSIKDSKLIMRRPQQQTLFQDSLRTLDKPPNTWTKKQSDSVYKALNLTLVNHNDTQVRMQDKFYGAMKKNGYSALVDINDQKYSSYHAKRPMIIFDTDKVKMQASTQLKPEQINKLYKKYNTERMIKEGFSAFTKTAPHVGKMSINEARYRMQKRTTEYLNS